MTRITYLGAGNMARSLIFGLLENGTEPDSLCASDPSTEALAVLASRGVRTTTSNVEAIAGATAIVLAVKPQVLPEVLRTLPPLEPSQLVISIAAGASISAIEAALGGSQPIVRCMPNTPALVGKGAAGLFANERVDDAQRDLAERLLEATGIVTWVDTEAGLDAITALSGSGPAYFFAMFEAMIDSAVEQGLNRDEATRFAAQTALGAATMVLETGTEPAQLRRNVSSPNGVTLAALEVLTEQGFAATVAAAMAAATIRSQTLAEEFARS